MQGSHVVSAIVIVVLDDFDFLLDHVLDALFFERVALGFLALFGIGGEGSSFSWAKVPYKYVANSWW